MYNEITSLPHFRISLPISFFTTMSNFSTQKISSELLAEIKEAIKDKYYGSVEIYIQDNRVTQITERVIRKLGEVKSKKEKRL